MPNYAGGGLLNLMASIESACGVDGLACPPLVGVDLYAWRHARNLVLILADGVGGDFLERTRPGGFLRRHQLTTLTSVCPTTTACAIPTLTSGLPPSAHGMTGWHVYLDEIDAVTAIMPLTARGTTRSPVPALEQTRCRFLASTGFLGRPCGTGSYKAATPR